MRIDVILDSFMSAADMVRYGELAEECGLGGVWIANNFNTRDAFVNFVPLALESDAIRMGPTAVSPFELHPMKIAHSLLTLNEIAAGRAQIVIGGGGGTAQNFGIKPQRMVRAVRECVEILNQAMSGKPGSYQGELYQVGWMEVDWARQPKPMIYDGAHADAAGRLEICRRHHDQRLHARAHPLGTRHRRPGPGDAGHRSRDLSFQ